MGLQLNRGECEISTRSGEWMEHLALQQFIPSAPEKACLLGASLSQEEALAPYIEFNCSELSLAVAVELENIAKHDALVLLRNALCFSENTSHSEMLPLL